MKPYVENDDWEEKYTIGRWIVLFVGIIIFCITIIWLYA